MDESVKDVVTSAPTQRQSEETPLEQQINFMAPEVQAVLPLLLADKSTGRNIIWATDPPQTLSDTVTDKSEMTPAQLHQLGFEAVQARAGKQADVQQKRTRRRGEVCTPAWVCNKMINALDADWFGREDVFNTEQPQGWQAREGQVEFPASKGKAPLWQQYIDSRRLEITCGEAPFLASRYDAATGEMIPVQQRIGILDRKLRVVSETVKEEKEWLYWAKRAVQATYGYEYQGDNLLLARTNLLLTFAEHLQARWQRSSTTQELKSTANIIAWNLWQMDGLKRSIPGGKLHPDTEQLDLFSMFGDAEESVPSVSCKVKNWRKGGHGTTQNFETIQEGSTSMKFDYVIGNPPYQEVDGGSGASATPVYNKFIEETKTLNPTAMSFIIPAKWYSGGKGLDKFREQMLNDKRMAVLVDYPNSLDVFPNVDVAGGVCYFVWAKSHEGKCYYINYRDGVKTSEYRDLNEFSTFIRYPIAAEIVKKVRLKGEQTLDTIVSSRKPFGLATNVKPLKAGDIQLRFNGGTGPYKRSLISTGIENIDRYKIIISYLTAEHAGQPDKNGQYRILSTMEKQPPKVVCSETYLVAGAFDTEAEADNYMRYLKTRFVRFLISILAMTQHISKGMFGFVPVQDFSRAWTDEELFSKYKLTSDEVAFIQSIIKEMA